MNTENTQAQAQAQAQENTVPATVQAAQGYDYSINTTGQTAVPAFTSLDVTTAAGKKKLYNITNRPDHNISDYINKDIRIKDIYVDVNPRMNKDKDSENYGVMEDKPRTVLIDENGESYIAGVSIGVFQAVREILRIFGTPDTWSEPLTVRPVTVRTPKGNMLSLEIV